MSAQQTPASKNQGQPTSLAARLKWPLISIVFILALVWLIPLLLSEDSGWRLGLPFRIFFTAIVFLGGLFFVLLESPAPRPPKTTLGVLGWITLIYLSTVGFLVGIGMIFPQFQVPEEQVIIPSDSIARGRALFLDSTTTCILCHAIEGQGATRGPDLSGVATLAETRVEGLSAEEYIRQSILEPNAYIVDDFEPIMPDGLINVVGEDNFDDLVAFLMTLK